MKRATRHLFVAALLVAVSACAEGDAESVSSTVASAATVTDTSVVDTQTSLPGDFGSRYNGSPVAFWFWAPY